MMIHDLHTKLLLGQQRLHAVRLQEWIWRVHRALSEECNVSPQSLATSHIWNRVRTHMWADVDGYAFIARLQTEWPEVELSLVRSGDTFA